MAAPIGSPVLFNNDHTSPVGGNVSVPANAQLAVVVITAYRNSASWLAGATITLGGQAFGDIAPASTDAQTTYLQVYFGFLVNPPTGTQAFDWQWTGASPEYGPSVHLLFFDGVDTADPIKDSNRNQAGAATFTLGGLNAAAGDYSLFGFVNFNAYGTLTGGSQLAQAQYVNAYGTVRGGDGVTSFALTAGGSFGTGGAIVIRNAGGGTAHALEGGATGAGTAAGAASVSKPLGGSAQGGSSATGATTVGKPLGGGAQGGGSAAGGATVGKPLGGAAQGAGSAAGELAADRQLTVTLYQRPNLGDPAEPLANATGLWWAWWSTFASFLAGNAPTARGSGATTDANGVFLVQIEGSYTPGANQGFGVIGNLDATPDLIERAYVGTFDVL